MKSTTQFINSEIYKEGGYEIEKQEGGDAENVWNCQTAQIYARD